ncbi:MAG: hypothetical protein RLZZ511_1405 [Cyanobacteriota bacterium]|jgi:hypothetical protein
MLNSRPHDDRFVVATPSFPSVQTLRQVWRPPLAVWQPWLLSRLVIWVGMGLVAPSLPIAGAAIADRRGWWLFLTGDGEWYSQIANFGYIPDAGQAMPSLAFLPFYPMLCRLVMEIGQVPFIGAGLVVNNLAFLLALTLLHRWIVARWNVTIAKWTIAAIAWFPLSIFCGLADVDGLFLLLNVLTLQCFSRRYYGLAAGFGALATATRTMGLSLMPTLISTAWQHRRSRLAYWVGPLGLIGFGLYSLYCGWRTGDLFAFDNALNFLPQKPPNLLDWKAWGETLRGGIVGPIDPRNGNLKSIFYPLQFCTIEVLAFLLWRFPDRLRPQWRPWGAVALGLWFWLLWPWGFVRMMTVVGGIALFWTQRLRMGVLLTNYGFWSLLWLAFSSHPISPERGFFGIVSLPIALGFWLARRPNWRVPLISGFGVMLLGSAVLLAIGQLPR